MTSSILVVAAVPQELTPFLKSADGKVQVLFTGIGRRRARARVERFLKKGTVDQVISAGFSGGTRSGLKVGDLVVASEVIDASSGRRFTPTVPPVQGGIEDACVGPLVTVDRLVSHPQGKRDLGIRFGSVAVDMETAAVAETAQQAGIPWLAMRVILDPMEISLDLRSFFRLLKSMGVANRSLAVGLKQLMERRLFNGSGQSGRPDRVGISVF